MSEEIDAFGEIYMAYIRGEPSNHYTERDDGYKHESESARLKEGEIIINEGKNNRISIL